MGFKMILAAIVMSVIAIIAIASFQGQSVAKDKQKATITTAEGKTMSISHLDDLEYYVTQEDGTEPAFKNKYWDNKEPGIYVDVVSGEALFSSIDKFVSGTGWPSFTKPIEMNSVSSKTDYKLFLPRTEVRSAEADSHLGHVFNDGPKDAGGMRYCINSAALRFIHKDDLESEGYGKYLEMFKDH